MAYDTQFTEDNQQILKNSGLYNVDLIKTAGNESNVDIGWTQTLRCLTGCEETYKECVYKINGKGEADGSSVKVFVAKECGNPPSKINTLGHKMGEGKLHFGYIFWDDNKDRASIFFVIHPNSWGPYQHRFHTNALTQTVRTAAAMGTGAAVGSIIPGIGTAAGAAVGFVTQGVFNSLAGDYLRYIG